MDAFAQYYDFMVGANYNQMADYILSSVEKYKPDTELVCDLGCGTGKLATLLSKSGFDMIGIDSDESMLMKARENIIDSEAKDILLLNQDITDFELYGTVDLICSTLDTINYILCKRDLERLFKLVKNYLNYDGLFIFDINTEYKFKKVLSDNDFIYDTEDLFCCWSAEFDNKTDKCYHCLTYFEKDNSGKYVKKENYQQQRFYSPEYIKTLIDKYNFQILSVSDDYSDRKPKTNTQRLTYILKINK